ncbi:peptidase M76 family-domain-containing protein [Lanmaoa asiatica]|nr:peptidase M76 family-domain-containing protein [Lanmaoa asiatica]
MCAPCDLTRSGGFHPAGAIVLCQNHPGSKRHLEDTLTHELIHMYDHCKFNVDWHNLRHHACSEVSPWNRFFFLSSFLLLTDCALQKIRANSLSGDCRYMRELGRGHVSFTKQHQVVPPMLAISVLTPPFLSFDPCPPRPLHFWMGTQACVRRRAILSVRANPKCPDEATAARAVNEVWESCFTDTRPFDEVRQSGFVRVCVMDDVSSHADLLDRFTIIGLEEDPPIGEIGQRSGVFMYHTASPGGCI